MTKIPNFLPDEGDLEIEALLRQGAPALPKALKSQTLTTCANRAAVQRQRQSRLRWQLTWAFAGVVAIQSLTLFCVDAQSTRLLTGNELQPPLFASFSIGEVAQLWHQRALQIAQLMEPSHLG